MKGLRLLAILLLAGGTLHAQAPRVTAITGATLVDGTSRPPLRDAVILVDGARITQVGARASVAVPTGAAIVDGQGKYVIPGLADMHNHLQAGDMQPQQNLRANLRRMLAVGITTVFNPSVSLKDFAALKSASSGDAAPFARFFSTGPIVTTPGDTLGKMVGSPTPGTAEQARAVIRDLKAAGVDAIKFQRDDASWSFKGGIPVMTQDVVAAVVDEAHQQGLKAFVHAPLLEHAKAALRAGADGLMHGIIDQPLDREFIDLMLRHRASYVSTMGLFHDIADVGSWARLQAPNWDRAGLQPPRIYEPFTTPAGAQLFQAFFNNAEFTRKGLPVQRANLKRAFDAGVPIVLGTDSGFFGVLLGASTQVELELLVDAGLRPEDALRAATINGARMIGREKELGTVEPGKAADLVILDADPLADIRNVARVHRTMKGGVFFEPVDTAKPQ